MGRIPAGPSLIFFGGRTGDGVKKGNWIPVDKALAALLPKNRPYSEIEAYLSLRIDLDNNRVGTGRGYASLWGWSRNKAERFMELLKKNPDGTGMGQRRGQPGATNGPVICFKFNNLESTEGQPGATHGANQGPIYNTDTKPKPKKTKKTFSSDSVEYGLAELLLRRIRGRLPDLKEPDLQSWARDIDLMIRIDKRQPERVKAVIEWAQSDAFWQTIILSAKKLREKYDQLCAKMEGSNGTGRNGTTGGQRSTARYPSRAGNYGDGTPFPDDLN